MKKSLFLGLGLLLAAGFTACKDDALTEDNSSQIVQEDTSFYINVAVYGEGENTRAGYDGTTEPDYDKGTWGEKDDYENSVFNVYLIFYDSEGRRVSTTQAMYDGETQLTGPTSGTGSENSIYKGVVQVDVNHGYGIPQQVLAFINPITGLNFADNPDFALLSDVDNITRPSIISKNDKFAMSKSTYYGVNPNSNSQEKVRIAATPIGSGQLFSTREQAEQALNDDTSIVDIYVERYAAKVTLNLGEGIWDNKLEVSPYTSGYASANKIELKFVPEYWAVNAYEDQTYVVKSFYTDNEKTTMASFTWMDNFLSGGTAEEKGKYPWFWNNEEAHRCYWGQSPGYYSDSEKYPMVADDVWDNRTNQLDPTDKAGFALNYYSYNNMKENATEELNSRSRAIVNENLRTSVGPFQSIYCRENTVAGRVLRETAANPLSSPKAAIGSVVIVGSYMVDGEPIKDKTFYIIGNNEDDYRYVSNDRDMLWHFFSQGTTLAANASGTASILDEDGYLDPRYDQLFTIEHPKPAVRNGMILDSRFVTLQIDKDAYKNSNITLYALLNNKYEEIQKNEEDGGVSIDYVNYQIFSSAGIARGFQEGKAYFSVPIQHLGFYRKDNPNAGKYINDDEFDWNEVQSGDFGVVRNHSYTIEATSIGGLGNAIPDPDVPIVPPTDPDKNFIGARIIVLNWAIVPTQKVVL